MLGSRIAERIKALSISQSELARRADVPQTTINSLVRGSRRSTPHIVKIARELGTTEAYLTGESDDPDQDAPAAPALDADTRELVENVKSLTPADRRALLQIARSMAAGGGADTTVHTSSGRANRASQKAGR